jgi:O-antigen ligase
MNLKENIIHKGIWIILGLIMFVPIYVNSDFFFPYIFSKTLAFRILVEMLLLLWLVWLWLKKENRFRLDWLTITFFLLIVFMFISSLFGADFNFSFWSNTERGEGILLWLHLFAFFVVLRNFVKGSRAWSWLFDMFVIAAQVVAVLGLFQYFDFDFVNKTGAGNERIASTIGNAAYLGGYMLFAAFLALYLAVKRRKKWLLIYYIPVIFLDIFILIQTGTRGAFLALLVSVALFLLYNLFRLSNKKLKIYALAGVILFAILSSFVYINKDSQWVANNFTLNRLTSISLSERTAQTRFMTWNSAWQGFKERPILGYGQENFYVVFNKYFNPEIYSHAGSRIWFDRAHNIFLDHLATGGLIGLLLYSILIFGPAWVLFKKGVLRKSVKQTDDKQPKKSINLPEQILLLAIVAFVIQGLIVFEALVTYLPLFLILACIGSKYTKPIKRWNNSKIILGVLVVYLIALFPIMHFVNIKETKANATLLQAMHLQSVSIDQAVETYFESINYNTLGKQEFRRRATEYIDSLVLSQAATPLQIINYVERIDNELIKRTQENPYDVTNYLLLMRHYNYTYVLNPERLYEVGPIGEIALSYSPTRPQIYYELGYADMYLYGLSLENGQTEQAMFYQNRTKENFDKAIKLNDDVAESYVSTMMALMNIDRGDLVPEYLDKMLAVGIDKLSENSIVRLANAAKFSEDFEWAIYFYELLIANYNNVPDYYINLALLYASMEDFDKAIAVAEEIKNFGDPYIMQAEQFIIDLKNGDFKK